MLLIRGIVNAQDVKLAGVSCSKILEANATSDITRIEIWRIVGPASGLQNLIATFPSSVKCVMIVWALDGVNQTAPNGTPASRANGAPSLENILTDFPTATNEYILTATSRRNTGNVSSCTPFGISIGPFESGPTDLEVEGAGGDGAGPGASVTITWSGTNNTFGVSAAVSVKPSLGNVFPGDVRVVSGVLELETPDQQAGAVSLTTVDLFDLVGSYALSILNDVGVQASTRTMSPLIVRVDDSNYLEFAISNGTLSANKVVGGVSTQLETTSYNPISHNWFRIRELSGQTYFETRSDSGAWGAPSNLPDVWNFSNPIALTAIKTRFQISQTTALPSTVAKVDNYNRDIVGPGPGPGPGPVGVSGMTMVGIS